MSNEGLTMKSLQSPMTLYFEGKNGSDSAHVFPKTEIKSSNHSEMDSNDIVPLCRYRCGAASAFLLNEK